MQEYLKTQKDSALEAGILAPDSMVSSSTWPEWIKSGSEEETQRGILPQALELANILDWLWDEMLAAPLYAVE